MLRHLSNRHIMGAAVPNPKDALDTWELLSRDERLFEIEVVPAETERFLRRNVRDRDREPSPKLWTDAWLAALAEASGVSLVTFDQGFRRFDLTSLEVLEV